LQEALVEHIAAGRLHFVVNMERVTCLDSTAPAVLIGAWWRVRDHGGRLDLAAGAHSHPRRLNTR
jgi:anti-anti-sigma regulatory factor